MTSEMTLWLTRDGEPYGDYEIWLGPGEVKLAVSGLWEGGMLLTRTSAAQWHGWHNEESPLRLNPGGGPMQLRVDKHYGSNKDTTPGVCKDCEEFKECFEGICDNCWSEYEYCHICEEDIHGPEYNRNCTHLQWLSWGGYGGCGHVTLSDDDLNHYEAMGVRDDVWRLCGHLYLKPDGLTTLQQMQAALATHHYRRWHRILDNDPYDELRDIEEGTRLADGRAWFDSLEPGLTGRADDVTAGWIGEWLAMEREWAL